MAEGSPTRSDRYTVGSVAKAVRVVEIVADGPAEGLSLSEIHRSLGASKSTTYALVRTLLDLGFLRDLEPGPRYLPGMALVRLGDVAGQRLPLGPICRPILHDLARETGLTIRAAVAESGHPVFIERVDAPGAIRFHTPLGVRELPHSSSAGKAILATLTEAEVRAVATETGLPERTRKTITSVEELLDDLAATRARGYAVDDEEDVEGIFCIGAAFLDHTGRCAGAISATGIKLDLPARHVEQLGHAVRQAADKVTAQLGGAAGTPR